MAVKSTVISSFCVVLNAILNTLLFFGLFGFPKLGIAGAAITTSTARFVEVCWGILALSRAKKVKFQSAHLIHVDQRLHKDF